MQMQLFDKNGNDITASFLYQPNLLDNADFRNFINQRKKTTYIGIASNRVYTGDRWSIYGEGQTVNIKDTYVEFINDSAPGNLLQYLEFPLIEREIYTISANINGNIVKKNITGGTYDTNENLMYGSNGTYEYIAIHTDIGATNKLYWCKLEPGSIATPLVPRPYAEELALCQRYFNIISGVRAIGVESNTAAKRFMYSIPKTSVMRTAPTITIGGNTTENSASGICVRECENCIMYTGLSFSYEAQPRELLIAVNFAGSLPSKKPNETQIYISDNFYIYLDAEIY